MQTGFFFLKIFVFALAGLLAQAAEAPTNEVQRQEFILRLARLQEPALPATLTFDVLVKSLKEGIPPKPLEPSQQAGERGASRAVLSHVSLRSPDADDLLVFDSCLARWTLHRVGESPVHLTDLSDLESAFPGRSPVHTEWSRFLLSPGSSLWSNGMLLEHGQPQTFWGKGIDRDEISLRITDEKDGTIETLKTSVVNGRWRFDFSPTNFDSQSRFEFFVGASCPPALTYAHVAVGHLFIFAGDASVRGPEVVYSNTLRILRVAPSYANHPQTELGASDQWLNLGPGATTQAPLLAAAFASNVVTRMPVGLIIAACGVAPIEAWFPPNEPPRRGLRNPVGMWATNAFPNSSVYNAMLAPFLDTPDDLPPPFNPRGIVWAHGPWESAQKPTRSSIDYTRALAGVAGRISSRLPKSMLFLVQMHNPAGVAQSLNPALWQSIQWTQFDLGNGTSAKIIPTWDLRSDGLHLADDAYVTLAERLYRAALISRASPISMTVSDNIIGLANASRPGFDSHLQSTWFQLSAAGQTIRVQSVTTNGNTIWLQAAAPLPTPVALEFRPQGYAHTTNLTAQPSLSEPLPLFLLKSSP